MRRHQAPIRRGTEAPLVHVVPMVHIRPSSGSRMRERHKRESLATARRGTGWRPGMQPRKASSWNRSHRSEGPGQTVAFWVHLWLDNSGWTCSPREQTLYEICPIPAHHRQRQRTGHSADQKSLTILSVQGKWSGLILPYSRTAVYQLGGTELLKEIYLGSQTLLTTIPRTESSPYVHYCSKDTILQDIFAQISLKIRLSSEDWRSPKLMRLTLPAIRV